MYNTIFSPPRDRFTVSPQAVIMEPADFANFAELPPPKKTQPN